MEAVAHLVGRLELYLSGREYHSVMRPEGMLAHVAASSVAEIEIERFPQGALLTFSVEAGRVILDAVPEHACDEALRLEVAIWQRNCRRLVTGGRTPSHFSEANSASELA